MALLCARARKQRTIQYEAAHCVAYADHREHVTCTCASQLVYEPARRPATKYNSLPIKSQGAKIVVVRYGRNGQMVKQSSSVLISSAGLRRRQLQEGQHMLLSKLIHEIGGLIGCCMHYALDWERI